jgi:ectoine hydroxylase-related dioxygenase (phytanoyl-CoA dioxygenase family)
VTTLPHLDSVLGAKGFRAPLAWAVPTFARAVATGIVTEYQDLRTEIVRNPHHDTVWVRDAVRSPTLLDAVWSTIGPAVAVENTFLMVKWPGKDFLVPWHQDGIDERIELDPHRSVAAWLAISDATLATGCLNVIPGSQHLGYLPYEHEAINSATTRGRAGQAQGFGGGDIEQEVVAVELDAGSAVLMDVRLLHRSGSNAASSRGPRVGLNVRYVAPGGIRVRDYSSPSLDPISGSGW